MLFFTLLIFILICIFYFIYCSINKKVIKQKSQLALLLKNNNNLKEKLLTQDLFRTSDFENSSLKPIALEYTYPPFKTASIITNCSVYLAPLDNAPIVCQLQKNMSIEIQDSVLISDDIWYEINIDTPKRINSKGWIKGQYILK